MAETSECIMWSESRADGVARAKTEPNDSNLQYIVHNSIYLVQT